MNKEEFVKDVVNEYLNDPKYDMADIQIEPDESGYRTVTRLFSKSGEYSVIDEVHQDKDGVIILFRRKFGVK